MSSPTPPRVLIVDDEMLVAKILSLHLEESGYLTEWAKDGEQCGGAHAPSSTRPVA